MLCAKGIHVSEDCKLTLNVCGHRNACLVPNTRNKGASPKLPKYALANKLYLGCLPERFNDLTWSRNKFAHCTDQPSLSIGCTILTTRKIHIWPREILVHTLRTPSQLRKYCLTLRPMSPVRSALCLPVQIRLSQALN